MKMKKETSTQLLWSF